MNRFVVPSSLSRFLIALFLGWCVIVVGTGTVHAAPDITTITPDEGPEAGGTAVTIGGTGFENDASEVAVISEGVYAGAYTVVTDDTYLYVAGYFDTELTIGSETVTAQGFDDVFVAKFDQNGTIVWLKSGGSTNSDYPYGIQVDSDGNVYVAGNVANNATFGAQTETALGSNDIFLIKYDANGNEQWLNLYGGTGFDTTDNLVMDAAENLYLVGEYSGTANWGSYSDTSAGNTDVYVVKVNTSGVAQMLISGGGSNGDRAWGVAVDDENNILMTGLTNSANMTFGSLSVATAGGQDIYVAKFNSAGTEQWLKRAGGTGNDSGKSLAVDTDNNVYVGGDFRDTATFGSIQKISTGFGEAFLAKYNAAGTEQWVQVGTGADSGEYFSVEVDANNFIYVAGGFDTDITLGTTQLTSVSGAVLGKYDQAGNLMWAKMGDSDNWAYAFDSTTDQDGNVYLVGEFYEDADFGSFAEFISGENPMFITTYEQEYPTLTISGGSCTSLSFVSTTELTCSTPAGSAGVVDVIVTNPDTSSDTFVGGFTYTGGAPAASPTPTPTPSPTATPTPTPTPHPSPVTAGAAHLGGPADDVVLNTETPTFSWTAPAQPENVSSYQIIINGQSFFGDLPKESKETSDYILVYDSSNNSFLLQSKKVFESGTYAWKITSKSVTGHTTDTSERTFTIGGASTETTTGGTTGTTQFSDQDDEETGATSSAFLTSSDPDSSSSSTTTSTTQTSDTEPQTGAIQGLFSQLNLPSFPVVAEASQVALAPLEPVAPTAPIIVTLAAPVIMVAAVALQMGSAAFSPGILGKILQALGLFNYGVPQGLVFDSATHAPIPFALLTIANQDKTIQETSVSDVHGVYKGVKLPPGTYTIQAGHQEFAFPSRKPRPGYLTPQDFYVGAPFTVKSARTEQLFLIPMDNRSTGLRSVPFKTRLKHFTMWALRNQTLITWCFFIFSALMTLVSPTPINIILTSLYALFLGYKGIRALRRPLATGVVTDARRQPIDKAIIKFVQPEVNQLTAVVLSQADGRYRAFIEPGTYQMMVIKPGFVWSEGGSPLSFTELKLTKPKKLNVTLQSQQNIYDEMLQTTPKVVPSLT